MADYQLFIDGERCDAASGETFATHDPATGEKIADSRRGRMDDSRNRWLLGGRRNRGWCVPGMVVGPVSAGGRPARGRRSP